MPKSHESVRISRKPTHPGEILKKDILPQMGLRASQLAQIIGVSRQHLHRLLNGTSSITPETAVKLGSLFGNHAKFWLNLQDKYDIWEAEQKLHAKLTDIAAVRAQILASFNSG
ncbi:MAG: HigA family addiction module antitoxin [Sphingomonadales bacterium]